MQSSLIQYSRLTTMATVSLKYSPICTEWLLSFQRTQRSQLSCRNLGFDGMMIKNSTGPKIKNFWDTSQRLTSRQCKKMLIASGTAVQVSGC